VFRQVDEVARRQASMEWVLPPHERFSGTESAAPDLDLGLVLQDDFVGLNSAAQIAEQSDLHPNTVRFHLKILVDARLACCRTDPRRGASWRPRLLYTASTDHLDTLHSDSLHQPGYQLLADIFTSYLAANSTIATGLPEKAGRAFARRHRRPGLIGVAMSSAAPCRCMRIRRGRQTR